MWMAESRRLDDLLKADVFEFFRKHFGNETSLHKEWEVAVQVAGIV
jgi:hypothetical protein